VTGGAGFVGCHLARRLASEAADTVTIVDDFSRGRPDEELADLEALPNVELVTGDLTDPATLDQIEPAFDEVYHLAALIGVKHVLQRPDEVIRVNALATLHVLDWLRTSRSSPKLLFSSTSEAYAWTQQFYELPIPTPEDCPLLLTDLSLPRSSYAGSKIFGELAVTHLCGAARMPFVIVRYHNVYGPRMGFDHVIPELFQRAIGGEDPLVVYSPDHTRAFCYVSDAVEATVAAMRTRTADGATINIGNDHDEISIVELAKRVVEHAGLDRRLEGRRAPDDPVTRRCPDLTRARRLLGFEPQIDLDRGLDMTLAWYAARRTESRAPAWAEAR